MRKVRARRRKQLIATRLSLFPAHRRRIRRCLRQRVGTMRPILLKGHERPLTFIKYNREGDLLFTCAKDHHPTLWYSDDGERVGTYIGHNGAVWTCDITGTSSWGALISSGNHGNRNHYVGSTHDAIDASSKTHTDQYLKSLPPPSPNR